ncbi:hypothetical protein BGX24_008355 [Mortierella sp. AD032]|nr:hypothetical protein BGX24_008355 [Mortierella sp. AD032]
MTTPSATKGTGGSVPPKNTQTSALSQRLTTAAQETRGAMPSHFDYFPVGTGSASGKATPESTFIADMNDVTDIRKSSHQTYTPTMRRWKDFCERHKKEYGGPDGKKVYLVDSEDKVGRFLEEEVLIRGKSKRVKPNTGSSTEGFLEVTVGPDVVKMARSALGRIHRLQMRRKEVGQVGPSEMKIFQERIAQCAKAMAGREDGGYSKDGASRARDYYSLDNLVTALNALWDGPDARKDSGDSFMDMFCIAATHNMLLRDEELHEINFSDCFAVVPMQNRHAEAQQCVALTFKLKSVNPSSDAESKLYVSALRHYDVGRCSFSAFAFYMFQTWQGSTGKEPQQNRSLSAIFRDLGKKEWTLFKLLPGTVEPTGSSSPQAVWGSIKKTFKNLNVSFPRKVDGGRFVGTNEAQRLKIPQGDVAAGGRWSVERGMYGECQIPHLRTTIPGGMAGFLDKPFVLSRNKVSPPIPLQMLIFPWIEFAFGVNNTWWKQECWDEMHEVIKGPESTPVRASKKKAGNNAEKTVNGNGKGNFRESKGKQVDRRGRDDEQEYNEATARNSSSSPDEAGSDAEFDAESVASARNSPASSAHDQEAANSTEYGDEEEDDSAANDGRSPPATFSEADKIKAGFLRLLVRCRRIILQDAAFRLHRHQPNKILDHDIFRCSMFKTFQQEIGAAIDKDAAALSKKRPRQKSPSAGNSQFRPISTARTQSPVQKHQHQLEHRQQQHEVTIDKEASSTTEHSDHQHTQLQPKVHYRVTLAQPASVSDQQSQLSQQHPPPPPPPRTEVTPPPRTEVPPPPPPRTEVPPPPRSEVPPPPQPPSTYAALEQQMLQMQHMIQTWGQHQESQMQHMYAQHMKIHEMQQQMITTMMAALRTQQSSQLQHQWPTSHPPPPLPGSLLVSSSASAFATAPSDAHQQPNGTSLQPTGSIVPVASGAAVLAPPSPAAWAGATAATSMHSAPYTAAPPVAPTNPIGTAPAAFSSKSTSKN